ncbi:MAG: hypothetical protein IID15_04700 [Candidatus Marinimicrobia bacterium]|nr:hypothetical protein [Candidatus Neomarinimicrobiota bacterium]
MTDEDLDNKFYGLTEAHLSDAGRARIKETIWDCENLAGVGQFMTAMVADR